MERWYTFFHLTFLYLIPLLVIVICYTGICIKSFSRAGKTDSSGAVGQQATRNIAGNDLGVSEEREEEDRLTAEPPACNSSMKRVCISVDKESKVDIIEMDSLSNATEIPSASGGVVAPKSSRSEKQHEVRRSIMKQTFVIVIAFLVCWSPYVLTCLWYLFAPYSVRRTNTQLQDVLSLFAVSNSAVNPFIYGKFVRSEQKST